MILEMFSEIFEKTLKYKIPWKSVQWEPSCSMRAVGRTDRRTEGLDEDKREEYNGRFSKFCESF